MMKYQLVIQFESEDFDELLAREDALISGLGKHGEVDGHDVGSGQSNIFIFTDMPTTAFQSAKDILSATQLLPSRYSAAWKLIGEDTFTVIWPPGSSVFEVA